MAQQYVSCACPQQEDLSCVYSQYEAIPSGVIEKRASREARQWGYKHQSPSDKMHSGFRISMVSSSTNSLITEHA